MKNKSLLIRKSTDYINYSSKETVNKIKNRKTRRILKFFLFSTLLMFCNYTNSQTLNIPVNGETIINEVKKNFVFQSSLTNHCTLGCNSNAYVNSVDPNTIEYDAMVSGFHSTIIKENDGTYKIWGEKSASDGTSSLISPTVIDPTNGFNYIGTPLKATLGDQAWASQFTLLTTNGLYVWGTVNTLISSSIKNTTAFGKISVNGKTDGLPIGVDPTDVKMMFGSYGTLAIVTCTGEAWVLSFNGAKNGDGSAQSAANNIIWHRVKTVAPGNPNLSDVVAMRGTSNALFALTSDGKLYTWGTTTFINNGASDTDRTYATEVIVPTGATPKMIGMTQYNISQQTYYLLATNGKLYSMGFNSVKSLGDGTTTISTNWVQPQKITNQSGQGVGVLENIVWISPSEHSYDSHSSSINVLTSNNKQWAWGLNSGMMIGGAVSGTAYDPIYMPGNSTNANGLKLTDEIIAVETGGHTSMNVKKYSEEFGYVGHKVYGSMGDGSNGDSNVNVYSYSTAKINLCGAETTPVTDIYVTKTDGKLKYTSGTTNVYTIEVGNNGPADAQDIYVFDDIPYGLSSANVTYTAVASGGAATSVIGTMTGDIFDTANIPVGGKIVYTVTVQIPTNFTGDLVNQASAYYESDSDLSNNEAKDRDIANQCFEDILNWKNTQIEDPKRAGFDFYYGGNETNVYSANDAGGTTIATAYFDAVASITVDKLEFDFSFQDYDDGLSTELWVNGTKYMDVIIPPDNDPIHGMYYVADYDNITVTAPVTAYNGAVVNGTNTINVSESKFDPPATSTGWVKNHIVLTFPSPVTLNSESIQVKNIYPHLAETADWRSQGDYKYYFRLPYCLNSTCTKPATHGTPDGYSKVGITIQQKHDAWPENIPNGHIALESKTKGFVITRVANQNAIADPKEGMLIYDIAAACVKLYNGMIWNCIKKNCDN